MRNGNFLKREGLPPHVFFVLILPMRNGNYIIKNISKILTIIVLILPMRNGNHLLVFLIMQKIFVLILPMRNGNLPYLSEILWIHLGSYPTYEEWKHSFHKITPFLYSEAQFLSYL